MKGYATVDVGAARLFYPQATVDVFNIGELTVVDHDTEEDRASFRPGEWRSATVFDDQYGLLFCIQPASVEYAS